jgi:peroxiredoxin Q/BCP
MDTNAPNPARDATQLSPETGLTVGQILLIGAIVVAGVAAVAVTAARIMMPPPREENLARQAVQYLRHRKGTPLSTPLEQLLTKPDLVLTASENHPLIGKQAPDFTLKNHLGETVTLSELNRNGPVIVIFYYGYWCDHCVAQLFGVHEDIARFRELDAQVVAVSADPPEVTKERFDQYGAFAFPTVSDPDNQVAAKYGCSIAENDGTSQTLHGTFVIGRDGNVHWVNTGHQPFLGNPTLLYELARLEGRLPAAEKTDP